MSTASTSAAAAVLGAPVAACECLSSSQQRWRVAAKKQIMAGRCATALQQATSHEDFTAVLKKPRCVT